MTMGMNNINIILLKKDLRQKGKGGIHVLICMIVQEVAGICVCGGGKN